MLSHNLGEFGREEVYVETENSVYRLTFRSGTRAAAARPLVKEASER